MTSIFLGGHRRRQILIAITVAVATGVCRANDNNSQANSQAVAWIGAPVERPPLQRQDHAVGTPEPATNTPPSWTIKPTDRNLAQVFERWTAAAGMKLLWDAQQHVNLSTTDEFTGTFDEAITRVLSSAAIRKSKYPLEGCIYNNAPPVLRITKLGEQDCAK